MKNKNGITLIALVITVIVLLILAGVSIATLTGQNGILTQAENAESETEEIRELEKIQLAATAAKIDGIGEINNKEKLIEELRNNGINLEDEQLVQCEDLWIYNKGQDIIYVITKKGEVKKDDLQNGNIPIGYKKVKYLCDNGKQYIKTGYAHDSNVIFSMTTTWDNLIKYAHLYYGSKTGDGEAIRLSTYSQAPRVIAYTVGKIPWVNCFYNLYSSDGKTNVNIKCGNNIGLFMNNEQKIEKYNEASFDAAEVYLFAVNNSNNEVEYSNSMKIIIDFEIYKDEANPILQFIPCLDWSGRPCMYDAISHKPFYNAGTGEFGYELEDGTYVSPQ